MTAELLVRVGAPLAAFGLAALALGTDRRLRLAGLAAWGAGLALYVPYLLPDERAALIVAAALGGAAVVAGLGVLFVRWPWAVAFLALAAAPARVPVTVGDESANLLLPLYVVVGGAAVALALTLWRGPATKRELGPLAWPLAALVVWFSVASLWTEDVREAVIPLFFYVLPFGLLAVVISRLPWRERMVGALGALLLAEAFVIAAVGVWQWWTRDIFWNPKVIVSNAYAPFYRVNSVFWDPSIYGRFLVIAILTALVLLLFRVRPRLELVLGGLIVVAWIGLLLSFSQSSFFALAVGVVAAAFLAWRWQAAWAVALVAAVMVPVGFAAPQLDDVRDNLLSSSTDGLNRATSGRSKLVGNGLRIAADDPVFGVGTGGFKDAYAARQNLRGEAPATASHTTPVTVAAETGIVGLVLFGWLLVAAFLLAFRGNGAGASTAEKTALVSGVGVVAIFTHSLFYNAFFEDPMVWGFLGLTALATRAHGGATS